MIPLFGLSVAKLTDCSRYQAMERWGGLVGQSRGAFEQRYKNKFITTRLSRSKPTVVFYVQKHEHLIVTARLTALSRS